MKYDRVIQVNLEDCKIISKDVRVEEISDTSTINIWMLGTEKRTEIVPMTYLIYHFEGRKFQSKVILHNSDFVRMKLLTRRTTNVYLNNSNGDYYFDIDFLKEG